LARLVDVRFWSVKKKLHCEDLDNLTRDFVEWHTFWSYFNSELEIMLLWVDIQLHMFLYLVWIWTETKQIYFVMWQTVTETWCPKIF